MLQPYLPASHNAMVYRRRVYWAVRSSFAFQGNRWKQRYQELFGAEQAFVRAIAP